MRDRKEFFKLSAMAVLIAGVFVSVAARADDAETAALMNPTSSVEVEAIGVNTSSAKFGEYNGLNKQGGYANGGLNIRGGDAYKGNQEGGTTRWSVIGTDLGLSDRSASAAISDQGSWNVGIGYDALTHNLSDTYRTPYQGSMGGNTWTLPSNTGVPVTTGTGVPASTFQQVDISTTRTNTSLNGGVIVDKSLNINFDYNHLVQSGAKLGAVASSQFPNANIKNEGVSILPMPTNYITDTLNLAANWKGESSHLTFGYFGSFFQDANSATNFQTWLATSGTGYTPTTAMQSLTTAPSNNFQQLNLSGGYDLATKTKLVGNLSYGINTQDSAFVQGTAGSGGMMIQNAPQASLNGMVYNTHADLKVTDQSIKDLNLSALYRYDERNNQTQSNMYNFSSISPGVPTAGTPKVPTDGTTNSGIAYYPNTPLSIRTGLFQLAGDYRLTKDQKVNLTYANEAVTRWCNNYASGNTGNQAYLTASTMQYSASPTAATAFPAGAQCVSATSSQTNAVNALYKLRANEELDFKLGYGISARNTSYDQNAVAAFYSTSATPPTGSVAGKNGGNYYGYMPFFEASNNQQLAKANVNWRPTEDMSFGLGGKYVYTYYPNSTYGVQNSTMASLNLDADYRYMEGGSVTAYATQQNGVRNLTQASAGTMAAVTNSWYNQLTENDTTVGLGVRHNGLMSGKLNLIGDLTYSLGQTNYNTTGPGCSTTTGTCGSPGTIRNAMTQVKFGANYQLDRNSIFGLRYIYQQLNSNDYYYYAYSMAGTGPSNVLPTGQTSGSYIVNVISASYTYRFD